MDSQNCRVNILLCFKKIVAGFAAHLPLVTKAFGSKNQANVVQGVRQQVCRLNLLNGDYVEHNNINEYVNLHTQCRYIYDTLLEMKNKMV